MRTHNQRIIFLCWLIPQLFLICSACTSRDEFTVVDNKLLYIQSGSNIEIKKLGPYQEFQGYGVIDKKKIFIAYSASNAEASTFLSVFDLNERKENVILELGATGESRFSYNKNLGLVVFDWYDGLYIFYIDFLENLTRGQDPMPAFEKSVTLIKKCDRCFEPHWVDNHIEYHQYDEYGQETVQSLNLPTEILNKAD